MASDIFPLHKLPAESRRSKTISFWCMASLCNGHARQHVKKNRNSSAVFTSNTPIRHDIKPRKKSSLQKGCLQGRNLLCMDLLRSGSRKNKTTQISLERPMQRIVLWTQSWKCLWRVHAKFSLENLENRIAELHSNGGLQAGMEDQLANGFAAHSADTLR